MGMELAELPAASRAVTTTAAGPSASAVVSKLVLNGAVVTVVRTWPRTEKSTLASGPLSLTAASRGIVARTGPDAGAISATLGAATSENRAVTATGWDAGAHTRSGQTATMT